MRHNRVVCLVPSLFRCSNAGCSGCVQSLKFPGFRPHCLGCRQNFYSHRGYFLTFRHRSVSLLTIGEKGAGSNFHRRVAVVCRFVPTSR